MGFKEGKDPAMIPTENSIKAHMKKESLAVKSGSVRTVLCLTALMIAAVHANHPRESVAIKDSFVRMLS